MKHFLQAAETWVAAMRRTLSEEGADNVGGCVSGYDELEEEARLIEQQLRGGGLLDASAKQALLNSLNEIGRQAVVCAALAESRARYLRWGQSASRPAREYTPEGTVAPDRPSAAHWEV